MSQPSTFSLLELGYVITEQGACLPVQEVDLPLWKHGEAGQDPKDFAFRFKAGGIWHHMQVRTHSLLALHATTQSISQVKLLFCFYTRNCKS